MSKHIKVDFICLAETFPQFTFSASVIITRVLPQQFSQASSQSISPALHAPLFPTLVHQGHYQICLFWNYTGSETT